jgi:hypothetical protein
MTSPCFNAASGLQPSTENVSATIATYANGFMAAVMRKWAGVVYTNVRLLTFRDAAAQQLFQLGFELADIFEIAIDRGKADIGHGIQLAQA